MRVLVFAVVLGVLGVFGVAAASLDSFVNDPTRILVVNSMGTTWEAAPSARFENATLKDVKVLCGSLETAESLAKLPQKKVEVASDIPETFESRTQWPNCKQLSTVRDQSACGSCWSVSMAETASARICIASNGTKQVALAGGDPMSCCSFFCGNGCGGGYPSAAWGYFKSTGLVDGGLYGDKSTCYPYPLAPCSHHESGKYPACGSEGSTPACPNSCDNSESWTGAKHMGASSYSISSNVEAIQTEIMQHGPVQATFSVYADFPTYRKGVYQHTSGSYLGGHAVSIQGWTTYQGTPAWIVKNSWNSGWGNDGFFMILRGSDECGIESGIVAGEPAL